MPRVFRLFRGLGLRHLVVIDEDYQVSTMLDVPVKASSGFLLLILSVSFL